MTQEGATRKVPLRLVLVIPFVLQVFGAVGLVGYLSLRFGAKSSNRIDQHLEGYLSTARQLGFISASSSTEHPYTLNNGKPSRLQALNSTDPLIRETAKYLTKRFQNLNNIQQQQLDFKIDNRCPSERLFIQVTP